MNQVRMLEDAVTKTLRGGRVVVMAISHERAVYLKKTARESIPNRRVRQETANRIVIIGGGELRFQAQSDDKALRGFSGEVFEVSPDRDDDWILRTLFSPSVPIRTRFERIDDE